MKCEVCGNEYQNSFTVTLGGEEHTFDSFECAIQGLAPVCDHCGCRVIGHGVEEGGKMFCCHHCATMAAAQPPKRRKQATRRTSSRELEHADALVGEASEEPFPASDAPAWTSGRE